MKGSHLVLGHIWNWLTGRFTSRMGRRIGTDALQPRRESQRVSPDKPFLNPPPSSGLFSNPEFNADQWISGRKKRLLQVFTGMEGGEVFPFSFPRSMGGKINHTGLLVQIVLEFGGNVFPDVGEKKKQEKGGNQKFRTNFS